MHLVAIGGSDAGISAALRARELDPSVEVTVVVADRYPNYSICGIPYYFSGDVHPWQSLAHRTHADLEATGMRLRLDTLATDIDVPGRRLTVRDGEGESVIAYDELIVGTGALPAHAGIYGLDQLGPDDGVHVMHSMGDTFALDDHLAEREPKTAIIIGAGYVGLEMAEGFTARGIRVTQLQRGPEVLSTLDPELASIVHDELVPHGVTVHTNTTVRAVEKTGSGLAVHAEQDGRAGRSYCGPRPRRRGRPPEHRSARAGGCNARRGAGGRGGRSDAYGHPARVRCRRWSGHAPPSAGCHVSAARHDRAQAGPNRRRMPSAAPVAFAGSVGTQVVKVFDVVAARTGLREHEAVAAGFKSATTSAIADDHKRLPWRPADQHPHHRRHRDRAAARRPARRAARHRDGEARGHLRHGLVRRAHRRTGQRSRPLLHPSPRIAVGCRPGSDAGLVARAHGCGGNRMTAPRTVLFICEHNAGKVAARRAPARSHHRR